MDEMIYQILYLQYLQSIQELIIMFNLDHVHVVPHTKQQGKKYDRIDKYNWNIRLYCLITNESCNLINVHS